MLAAASASAQVGPPGGGMGPPPSVGRPPGGGMGTPSPTKGKPGVKAAPGQETHAASNDEATQSLQTQEPTIPQEPLALPPALRKRIGTNADTDVATGKTDKVTRDF